MAVHICSVSCLSSWSASGLLYCTLNPTANTTGKRQVKSYQARSLSTSPGNCQDASDRVSQHVGSIFSHHYTANVQEG
jgi:hypothetical protein